MENIAREFFREESALSLETGYPGWQGIVSFLADNYPVIIGTYRAIKKQNIITAAKHQKAQKQIEKFRQIEISYQNKPKSIEKEDWKELNENLKYWKNQREEEDVIYYKNKPLRDNSITQFIFKYSNLMGMVDQMDSAARPQLGKNVRRLTRLATWPLKKLIMGAMILSGPNSAGMDYGAMVYGMVDSIPQALEARMSNIDPGRTSGSNTPEMDEMHVEEVKISS
jgi:hypothetical protein